VTWIAVSDLRNWVLKEPLFDWLDRFGEVKGYRKDSTSDAYLAAADYGVFVRDQGNLFEEHVLGLIRERIRVESIEGARGNHQTAYEHTLRLMKNGSDAVYQGLVRDPELELFGVPDLIIRGSALERVVPGTLGELEPGSYYILDIKFEGLDLNKRGDLKASHAWERIQLALYERGLAATLGRTPGKAFVLGRHIVSADERGGCFDLIPWVGPLDEKGMELVRDGLAWLRDLTEHGFEWSLDPPTDPRLRPNPKNKQDGSWHAVKKELVAELPATPWDGPKVQPERIEAARGDWFESRGLEFFVDFETFNSMNDDFSSLPAAGGRPMIFMIGCGHEVAGGWEFMVWTAREESYDEERRIIGEWLAHMDAIRHKLAPNAPDPLIYHWHDHEVKELAKASARHREPSWEEINWFDLLWRVFKAEPVRIAGTDGHSLKPVTRKLVELQLTETQWEDGPVSDGLAAMTAAWSCYAESRDRGLPVHEALTFQGRSLMREIEKYNEVDCRAMWEILSYLREHH